MFEMQLHFKQVININWYFITRKERTNKQADIGQACKKNHTRLKPDTAGMSFVFSSLCSNFVLLQ